MLHSQENEQDGESSEEGLELRVVGWHPKGARRVDGCDGRRRSLLADHVLQDQVQQLVRQLSYQEHHGVQLALEANQGNEGDDDRERREADERQQVTESIACNPFLPTSGAGLQ